MPPSASCEAAGARVRGAGEGAACAWPNSSHSSSASGIAPQLTATNGPVARARRAWSGAGDHLLAGAALAGDEDGGVGLGDGADDVEHAAERLFVADDSAGGRAAEGVRQNVAQRLGRERLGEKVRGAGAHQLDRGLHRAVPGQDDDRHAPLHRERDHLAAAGARHLEIRQHQLGARVIDLVGGLFAVDGGGDVAAFAHEAALERAPHVCIVFYD